MRPFSRHQKRKADDDTTPGAADEFAQFFSNDPRPEEAPVAAAAPGETPAPSVSMEEQSSAGWYPDTKDPGLMRYWDGFHLTGQTMRVGPPPQAAAEPMEETITPVASAPVASAPAPAAAPTPPAAAPPAPAAAPAAPAPPPPPPPAGGIGRNPAGPPARYATDLLAPDATPTPLLGSRLLPDAPAEKVAPPVQLGAAPSAPAAETPEAEPVEATATPGPDLATFGATADRIAQGAAPAFTPGPAAQTPVVQSIPVDVAETEAHPVEASEPVQQPVGSAEPAQEKIELPGPKEEATKEESVPTESTPDAVEPAPTEAPNVPAPVEAKVPAPVEAKVPAPVEAPKGGVAAGAARSDQPNSWAARIEEAVARAQATGTPQAWQEAAQAARVVSEMAQTMQIAADIRQSATQLQEAAADAKRRADEAEAAVADAQRGVRDTEQAAQRAAEAAEAATKKAEEAKSKAQQVAELSPRAVDRAKEAAEAAASANRRAQLVDEIVERARQADTPEAWSEARQNAERATGPDARDGRLPTT